MASGDETNVHTRITLPPPEYKPAPDAHEGGLAVEPLSRRGGRRAEEAGLRGDLEAARGSGDAEAELRAATALARHLATRERDVDEAVELGLRALELGEDGALRKEVAGWLESLGEPGTAAVVLRRLSANDGAQGAATMVRAGVLLARAGDAHGAASAFEDASRLDPADAMGLELKAALAGWAPDVVSARAASRAYVDAASRRREAGALPAEMEDLLRAFEAEPSSELAARSLATAFSERGRAQVEAEVWRAHAAVLEGPPQRLVLVRRMQEALRAHDLLGALGAALDGHLDGVLEGENAAAFDDLLLRIGLLEPLAARLEVEAERVSSEDRAGAAEQLARLFAGPLSSPDRAALQYVRILAEHPGRSEALEALRARAASGDRVALVEALVRGAAARSPDAAGRARCARLLAQLADEELHAPRLAAWAFAMLAEAEPEDAAAHAAAERLAARVGDAAEWTAFKSALEAELGKEARRLGLGRWVLRLELQAPGETEARAALAATARARGEAEEASAITAPLLDRPDATPRDVSLAWVGAALARDARTRARALEALAPSAAPQVAALLLAVAADGHAAAGDAEAARRAAERACQADPGSVRAVAALARASAGERDRTSASALERGLTVAFAGSSLCEALASALEQLGETDYAVAWTQRLMALRPGDLGTTRALVRRVAAAHDAARLMDTLLWLLPQPQPAGPLGDLLAEGLLALSELEPARAAMVARRTLDALGPRHDGLRAAIDTCAARARDGALAAAVLERRIAALATPSERPALRVELAGMRLELDEPEAAARQVTLALQHGFDPFEASELIDSLSGAAGSADGELWLKEARARLLAAKAEAGAAPLSRRGGRLPSPRGGPAEVAARAWRELGGARWDLAGDRRGAEEAWLRAARVAPSGGYLALGVDLASFAGARPALERLNELIALERDPVRAGAIAGEAVRAALAVGEPARAMELAETALAKNPMLADAVEIAERGALEAGTVRDMSRVYETLGLQARGRFGRRAAHYRGARFFEQRGEVQLAMKHAAQAFSAVPSEGATFLLLARIAAKAGDPTYAVHAIEEVAETAQRRAVRAGWLLRAASVAGGGEEGARVRVDVLLKAAFLQPTPSTLALLADAARDLIARVPEERSLLQVRLSRASSALAKRLEGPDGARVAVSFARLELDLFGDVDGAVDALERAFGSDADIEEYLELVPLAPRLATAADAAAVLARGLDMVAQPYSNVGVPALRLLGAMATARDDRPTAARFLMLAAERESDDDALVREADLAAATASGADLERFEKRIPAARRAHVHAAFAESERLAGRHDAAIASLERAIALAQGEEKKRLEARVREIYELSGRADELERRALAEAEDTDLLPGDRARHWTEIAVARESRGDVVGAVEALREAAHLDPEPLARWSQLERVSAMAGTHDARAEALREIEARVATDARPAVLRRLARALEETAELAAVEETWQRILELQPDDEEADRAIEDLVAREGDHARLAAHLARRAERLARFPEHRETLRVVRLRRAAILEQRLGQVQQACEELKRVVAEWPNNESALRYLGDLLEREGDYVAAIPVWRHLATLAADETSRADLTVRAAQAARGACDVARAEELARSVLTRTPGHREALELLVDLARDRGDHVVLADALAALAAAPAEDPGRRSDWLMEAAQSAARGGDAQAALGHAQRAAEIAPTRAATQLFARGLEYRVRGPGSAEDARHTLSELDRIDEAMTGDDLALSVFLRAEALDVAQGGGAGLLALQRASGDAAQHPLVAVAIADRLVASWQFADALPHYERALGGNLLGLRVPSTVALEAAEAASRADQPARAIDLLERAAEDPAAREPALKKIAHVAAVTGDSVRAREALESLVRTGTGDRAATLAQLGRLLFSVPGEREAATAAFREAIEAAPSDSVLRAQLEAELGALTLRRSGQMPETAPRSDGAPPAPLAEGASLGQLAASVAEAPAGAERTHARASLARAHLAQGDLALGESLLLECLAEGDVEAGDQLAAMLEREGGRGGDLVRIRRLQAEHAPGDVRLLGALREAALADRNLTYARAIDHVLRALDPGAGPLPPPPLTVQVEHPGLLTLLARPALDAVGEALALVWEGAGSVLARDPASYAISGLERVAPGSQTTIARLYEIALRLFGSPNIPLYARRGASTTGEGPASTTRVPSSPPDALAAGVALLPVLSATLVGDVRDDTVALRYSLGQAIAAALPQSALMMGLPEGEARVLWNAVLASFGPPEFGKLSDPSGTRLVQMFWNTVPPRVQRRLQEVLARVPTEFDGIVERSRQSGRRVGMFLAGDFGYAVRAVGAELGLDAPKLHVADLAGVCRAFPPIADLLRLAVSPEYADARFRPMPDGAPRATLSSGRYRIL